MKTKRKRAKLTLLSHNLNTYDCTLSLCANVARSAILIAPAICSEEKQAKELRFNEALQLRQPSRAYQKTIFTSALQMEKISFFFLFDFSFELFVAIYPFLVQMLPFKRKVFWGL